MDRLFVYGTLAPGRVNHHVLEAIPGVWQTAVMKGRLFEEGWGSQLGCPAVVPADDGDGVEGYVFASAQLSEHWAMLDAFEGTGYQRVPVRVRIDSGELVVAFVYALNKSF